MRVSIDEILMKVKEIDNRQKISKKKEIPPFSLENTGEDEFYRIPIEEYRQMEFTDEQEWNNIYNSKRCSIEALNYIEIKKRGEGPIKKTYTSLSSVKEGPYYDPIGIHVCVWRKNESINNFICEQVPSSKTIQFSDYKDGIYCAICHKKKECKEFNWSKINTPKRSNCEIMELDFKCDDKIQKTSYKETVIKKESRAIPNWEKLMIKCIHSIYNDKIVYPMSSKHSVLLWPWQMTNYQKFRYSNPDYKNSEIFLRSDIENFKDNYGVIN